MKHIVIVGAGIGGMSCAYELRAALGNRHRITVLNDSPRFSFTPSNPWVAVGWRVPKDIQIDVAPALARHDIGFIAESVARIDPLGKFVTTEVGRNIEYDYLVLSTGPRLAFDEVPGLGPNGGFTQSICTTAHAFGAWAAYEEFLKQPGPVVVGAAAGASCFGPAYEFAMILDSDLRKRKIRDRVPMTFVTSEPYVGHMGLGGVGDSKGLLEKEFRERHIRWIANARIASVERARMHVEELDDAGEPKREHALEFSYAMVLPAFTGVDAVRNVPELGNPRGFVLIDAHQRSPKFPEIFAAGVCVAIPPVEKTPVPTGAPKTGFMIESMVGAIVANIRADIEGRPALAEATWNAVCLADMGDKGAAFVALPQIPPRNVTWAKVGKWVHLAKVAFEKYFLRKMRTGNSEPVFEKYVMKALGISRLKSRAVTPSAENRL